MEPPTPRKSYIIDCQKIWPSPVTCLSIETEAASISGSQKKESKKEGRFNPRGGDSQKQQFVRV